jgi:MoaA/NifB/PqqE/SkfB family radical SAM enzyme
MYQKNISLELESLNPASYDHGLHAARNPLKPLNHLDLLTRREEIVNQLNLHSTSTPSVKFDINYELLEKHQAGLIGTDSVIDELALQTGTHNVRELLGEYFQVGHLEFHPSDVCNLECKGCTYMFDDPNLKPEGVFFPIDLIDRLKPFNPRSLHIVGGGEPTIYSSGLANFPDLIDRISETLPDTRLGLTTNGTKPIEGDCLGKFDWIRISLDAATIKTYRDFRGGYQFMGVLSHFLDYLDAEVNNVSIGYLYSKANIHEYAKVVDVVYNLVSKRKGHALPKVSIQFRPLRKDPKDEKRKFFNHAIDEAQIKQTVADIRQLVTNQPEIAEFIREQTNISSFLHGNHHTPHEFDRCNYSQIFSIVRADGSVRPCAVRIDDGDFLLGNILHDPIETIALNEIYVSPAIKPGCDPEGCRYSQLNNTLMQGLQGLQQPSKSPDIIKDSFI